MRTLSIWDGYGRGSQPLPLQELAASFKKVLVKIDVERYKFEVLRGANHLLSLNRPVALCVEVEIRERERLHKMIGDIYEDLAPEFYSGVAVLCGDDPSNVFFENGFWRDLGLPC